jgi:hypothetical protein
MSVRDLVIRRIAVESIPIGGGVADGVDFLLDADRVRRTAKAAKQWADEAIRKVREAADPNPWRGRSDDEIAAEILRTAFGE